MTSDSSKVKSLSLLYDDLTDTPSENEAAYAMYFNPTPEVQTLGMYVHNFLKWIT